MAANNYKIGDRVVVVSEWKRPMNDRFNWHLGKIRTIDSRCERVVGHNQRDKFYRFVEAQEEGHFWDDKDIVGLAPMIPKPVFPIKENQRVVMLACDGTQNDPIPGRVNYPGEDHFTVTDEYSKRVILFRNSDFVCDDPDQSTRMLVYESEEAMKKRSNPLPYAKGYAEYLHSLHEQNANGRRPGRIRKSDGALGRKSSSRSFQRTQCT